MDSIVDKLYQIQVNSGDFFAQVARGEESLREWELYTLLYEGLKEEDKKIFLEYATNNRSGRRLLFR